MMEYIAPLQQLIEQFRKLPGIGGKTAARLAFSVVGFSDEEARAFADAIIGVKENIHTCRICHNLSTGEYCPICTDDRRDQGVICVVEDAKDVLSMERVREFNGVFHVLGGTLSPINGIGPGELNIKDLLERIQNGDVREVIVATNPTVEGEATAMYIAKLLQSFDLSVTRLAYGIPVGGDLEYADEITLHRAVEGRRRMN